MKLEKAKQKLDQLVGIPFNELFSPADLQTIILNKGKTGQLLELALGLHLSNTNLDFENGELKTNKCDRDGTPLETVFITQVAGMIDDLLQRRPFEQTHLYSKIHNLLYVPVFKGRGDSVSPANWMFLQPIHVDLESTRFAQLNTLWAQDYDSICIQLINQIEKGSGGMIHTVSGTHLQIRTKDSKPYTPIYSQKYKRIISDKNRAFYFQKQFVYDIQRINR